MFLRYHDLLDFSYGNCTLYWICNIAKFSSLRWSGELRHVTVPSFVKNSQSVAEILRFFDCHSCHFLILEIAKFYWLTLSGDPSHITVLNVTKIGQSVAKIVIFHFFQDGCLPPSWIRFRHVWTTHRVYLVVSVSMQNLIMIDAVV